MSTAGHNVQTEREQWEEQQFHNGFRQIKELNSDMAGTKGEIGGVYKRLKDVGFTKADIKWAQELEEKDASEIIATMERRLRIARMFGHRVARQLDILEKDRTPAEDAAYEDGLAAGKGRKANANPYDTGSIQGQRWQAGFNDGTEFINKDLDSAVNGEEPFPDAAE
ncbi:hypothetical protein A6U86_05575 [Rhizobium sp. AC27/96]|uniref:hypothetical protein n=1 Tax=Rhizobium sp. AC27/96 TaxID=1841653 RepID=UPI000828A884|nr:hypothetical protein [Rhizobium sp. AC27/96]OCJ12492.1 hypothetical protein A6U86_05575 [Rhizobium sp. AC27/96]